MSEIALTFLETYWILVSSPFFFSSKPALMTPFPFKHKLLLHVKRVVCSHKSGKWGMPDSILGD